VGMTETGAGTLSANTHKVHPGLALVVIAGAQLMVILDATIVNIALPSIEQGLGFSPTSLAWVLNAYTLTFGGLLLLGGRAGDLFGRRRMFMIGIAIFATASLLAGLATSEAWLLGARVLQGVGAAIASPTALALVTTTFPEGPQRNRAFGVYAAVSGAGAAIGLILGGLLTDLASWRWVFFVNVPIAVALLVATPAVLHESDTIEGRLDLPGALTSTFGIGSLVYGFIHAASDGWRDPITMLAFGLAIILLASFFVIESRTAQPLMPLRLFSDRNRTSSYVIMLMIAAALFSMFFFLTQFVQEILGYSPLKAGFAFLPVSIVIVIVAQIVAKVITRTGPRPMLAVGSLAVGGGLLWFSTLSPSSGYLTMLLPAMIVMAFGLALIFVPVTLTAVAGVEHHDSGIASGMLNVSQQIGGTLGLSILVTVFATAFNDFLSAQLARLGPGVRTLTRPEQIAIQHSALAHGWATAFRFAAIFAAVAFVVTLVGIHVRPEDVGKEEHLAAAASA
jgi:EmrB/QacA subfamily drug resistance transporter